MVVTIDGPAAAGKSTAARALARRLGFDYLDTGAMYRAVSLAAIRAGTDLSNEPALGKLAASLDIRQQSDRIFLNGEDVTTAIRAAELSDMASVVAVSPAVRECMVALQRRIAESRNTVAEGRDQGTVVFPDAAVKFFLTASPDIRADRRQQEYARRGIHVTHGAVLADQAERDRRDAGRSVGPMLPADNAITIDSSDLNTDQVVDAMERAVREFRESSEPR